MPQLLLKGLCMKYLLFIDFETTSVDYNTCELLEFAYLLCNENMEITSKKSYLLSPSPPECWESSCKEFHKKHATASYQRLEKFAMDSNTKEEYFKQIVNIKRDLIELLEDSNIKKGSVTLSGRSFFNLDVPLFEKYFGISSKNPFPEAQEASEKLSYRLYDTNLLVFLDDTILKRYPQPHNAEEDVYNTYLLIKDMKGNMK